MARSGQWCSDRQVATSAEEANGGGFGWSGGKGRYQHCRPRGPDEMIGSVCCSK
jgi:hypothetical protein